jgi:TP901 family phage tail tape measure protein
MTVGDITARMTLDLTGFREGLAKANSLLEQYSGQMQSAGMAIASFGAAVTATMGVSVRESAKMESAFTDLNKVLNLTPGDLEKVVESLHALARATGIADEALAATLAGIGKAGMVGAEGTQVLEAAARAAVAGTADIAVVGEDLVSILRAYGLAGSEAAKVTDTLYQASIRGGGALADVMNAVRGMAPVAAELGVGYDELAAALATTATVGYDADTSIMGLTRAMINLANPGKQLAAALHAAGYESGQALLKARGYAGAIQFLTKVAGEDDQAMIQMAGGQKSFRAIAALATDQGRLFAQKLMEIAASAGAVDRAFSETGKTFQKGWDRFVQTGKQILETIGSGLLPVLGRLLGLMRQAGAAAQVFASQHQTLVAVLAVVTAGIGLLATAAGGAMLALGTLGVSVLAAPAGLAALGGILAAVTGALGALLPIIGPIVAALLSLGSLVFLFGQRGKQAAADLKPLGTATAAQTIEAQKLIGRYRELEKTTNRTSAQNQEMRDILDKLVQIAPEVISAYDKEGRALGIMGDAAETAAARLRKVHVEQLLVATQRRADLAQAASDARDAAAANAQLIADLKKQKKARGEPSILEEIFGGADIEVGIDARIDRLEAKQPELAAAAVKAAAASKEAWTKAFPTPPAPKGGPSPTKDILAASAARLGELKVAVDLAATFSAKAKAEHALANWARAEYPKIAALYEKTHTAPVLEHLKALAALASQEIKGGKTGLEISQATAEHLKLNVELARSDQERKAAIAAWTTWALAAIAKYRDSKVDAERAWAVELTNQLDVTRQAIDVWGEQTLVLGTHFDDAAQAVFHLRGELAELPVGTEEYRHKAADLADAQERLAAQFRDTTKQVQEQIDALLGILPITAQAMAPEERVFKLRVELSGAMPGTPEYDRIMHDLDYAMKQLEASHADAAGAIGEAWQRDLDILDRQNLTLQEQRNLVIDLMAKWSGAPEQLIYLGRKLEDINTQIAAGALTIGNVLRGATQGLQSAFSGLFEGLMKGTADFGAFMNQVLADIERQIAEMFAAKAVVGIFSWLGILGLQHGGVVTRPTMTMLGERGPEAVLPLSEAGQFGATFEAGAIVVNLDPAGMDALSVDRLADRLMNSISRKMGRLSPVRGVA